MNPSGFYVDPLKGFGKAINEKSLNFIEIQGLHHF